MINTEEFNNEKELLKEFFSINPEIVRIINGYTIESATSMEEAYYALESFIIENDLTNNRIFIHLLTSVKECLIKDNKQIIKSKDEFKEEKKTNSFIAVRLLNAPDSKIRNLFIPYYNLLETQENSNEILTTSYVDELNRGIRDRIRVKENESQPAPVILSKRIR